MNLGRYRASMKVRLTNSWFLLVTLALVGLAKSNEELSCYRCNADLTEGTKGECNDPYSPASLDLSQCPQDDSYLCLKSVILYNNVHVTVRGCILAKSKDTYCSFEEGFPDASVECLFCDGYACNSSPPSASSINRYLALSLITIVLASCVSYIR